MGQNNLLKFCSRRFTSKPKRIEGQRQALRFFSDDMIITCKLHGASMMSGSPIRYAARSELGICGRTAIISCHLRRMSTVTGILAKCLSKTGSRHGNHAVILMRFCSRLMPCSNMSLPQGASARVTGTDSAGSAQQAPTAMLGVGVRVNASDGRALRITYCKVRYS